MLPSDKDLRLNLLILITITYLNMAYAKIQMYVLLVMALDIHLQTVFILMLPDLLSEASKTEYEVKPKSICQK